MTMATRYFVPEPGAASGCEAHEDRGLLTLIAEDGPGLQVGLRA